MVCATMYPPRIMNAFTPLCSRLKRGTRALLDELGGKLKVGVRWLEAELASRFADGGVALQGSEFAEHHDVISMVLFEIRLQAAQAPETEVIFEHLVWWSHHLVLLLRQASVAIRARPKLQLARSRVDLVEG
jgi:hypothetical protein